ncbi:MAG: glycoside hydrolase family 3 N-terminal domain-containing protein, partial [Nitrospirota bacterium]|nr:glycoside hydrolase family 3 N-terminal domain-containing protein [Nitrospirota bacterium]
MNFYKFIIARLNGRDIEREFDYYLGLARKGIAGFIIFGGELNTVRRGISELQKEADNRLIIASDLERGLGQHIEGGTIFPPAMAIAKAIQNSKFKVQSSKLKILRDVFKTIALEARYAGINTIFAPVLDINTNPKNPIISTRAFGEDPESVSFFGCEMIKTFQSHGITACGKHFPGHGDTETDSHIKLPKIKKDIKSLSKAEIVPFRDAIKAGVKMIMMGHLSVPALDPSGIPVSLSQKAVSYLRKNLGFKGIVITDAMNMGALYPPTSPLAKGGCRGVEEEASLMALNAGVDILLHPTDPDRVVSYLGRKVLGVRCQVSGTQLWRKKKAALSI